MITKHRLEKFVLTFVFLFFCHTHGISQYGDYDLEDLQTKYPDKIGVILSHVQIVTVDVNKKTGLLDIYETDKEVILYLKESAKYYTDQSIMLSHFFEDLTQVEAHCISADGKKNKLKEEDFRVVDSQPSSWVFHDDNKEMIFDFVELGEGFISEVSYTKKIKRPEFFDVFHFISGYPVLNSTLEISSSDQVVLKYYEQAMDGYEVEHTSDTDKKGRKTDRWILKNLNAYRKEEGSTNIKNHIPHVVAQILSYESNGEIENLITNQSDLHDYFEEFLLLKGDESDRKELNEVVLDITDQFEDPIEKMDTIFRWVQSNIKYIAFEDGINGYVPRSCSSVMRNRFGDCKDMGNLLVEMLGFAGVEGAHVAWVGTRDIPYMMSEIPSPLTCNHVICVVENPNSTSNKDKYFYLDATSPESSYILPPMALQGKELLIHFGPGKFDLYKVEPAEATNNYIRSLIEYDFTESDSIFGKGTDVFGGYERESRAYYLSNLKDTELEDYIKDLALGGANRYSLEEFDISGLYEKKEALKVSYKFGVDNLGIKDGNDIILNPMLFKPRVTKYHSEDYHYTRKKERHRTIDYTYKIRIPDDYKIKHLPSGVDYQHKLFHFKAEFETDEDYIVVKLIYQYHLLEIPVALFDDWNAFSKSINSATIQNIILTPLEHPE